MTFDTKKAKKQAKKDVKAAKKAAEKQSDDAKKAAEDQIKAAKDQIKDARKAAKGQAKDAKKNAKKAVKDAKKGLSNTADEASSTLTDIVDDVVDFVEPRTRKARKQARKAAKRLEKTVAPTIEDAKDKLGDVAEKVQKDVYPQIQDMWSQAQENPQVHEATARGASAVAALRGDLSLPERKVPGKKKGCGFFRTLFTLLGIVAGIVAIAVIVRSLLGSKDDGWTIIDPDEDDDWGASPYEPAADEPKDDEPKVDEPKDEAAEDETDDEPQKAQRRAPEYGEGAYVGEEPPEGFTIKGNERSMKYHVPEAAGYERTNADVWFNSEEAAQQAGFTRALR